MRSRSTTRAPGSLPGFHSYFSIPAGKACADGRWLAGPGKDLFQTAYDELGPLNFIAEDLGYLTPGVRAMGFDLRLSRHGRAGV